MKRIADQIAEKVQDNGQGSGLYWFGGLPFEANFRFKLPKAVGDPEPTP